MTPRIPRRTALVLASALATASPALAQFDYVAGIHVVPSEAAAAEMARGFVFHDLDRDGRRSESEPGLPGVLVSNGREVVRTGSDGAYTLPVEADMTLMVIKPAGFAPPVNAAGVPQFFYTHKPEGSPAAFRFGGLAPTGPLPAEVSFPLVATEEGDRFSCIVAGDTQPYSNEEIGYLRDSMVTTALSRDLSAARCLVLLGDVMGDDLGLLPRLIDTMSVLGLPQYYVLGNHDIDFDATSDSDSADSWRQIYGPNHYAFEIGKVMFVVLDNVVYPCTAEEARDDDRARCGADPEKPIYNGRVDERQMQFLSALLSELPPDRLVVLMHHIPIVSYTDQDAGRHATDNALDLYALLKGRPALTLSGHSHTLEYLAAGEQFAGWEKHVGVTRLPFDHIVAGAPSGNWYFGDFGFDGTPMAFTRTGEPPGFLEIAFDGTDYVASFHALNQPAERQMSVSFNTPQFRRWYAELRAWIEARDQTEVWRDAPALTVHDLHDLRLFTPAELAEGVFLTVNFWFGDRNAQVTAEIAGGPALVLERTQPGEGEGKLSGAEWADPFAIARQATIGRYAFQSAAGDGTTDGFKLWDGYQYGPAPPQPVDGWALAEQSPHLWRARLPADLPEGSHVLTVTATDRHGRTAIERLVFEVRAERPPRFWRAELWAKD